MASTIGKREVSQNQGNNRVKAASRLEKYERRLDAIGTLELGAAPVLP